ncbi:MauE/DoxX family redox-associated membrane protein [Pseudomonas paralcaligenes]|uniref:MauE/DoxX family redox-associated membrane protein n=1 Tax=Pseudomonas paralcaligenes TaxID=2772558 RepID=UPI001C80D485|nr:MauE/DoxX family redox-associated membrane protein [Pseudomonas paralcaligenes]
MVIATYLHDPLVHLTSAMAMALLLGASALHKLRDLDGFAQILQRYGQSLAGLLPGWLQNLLVCLLPALELLAAAGLLASYWLAWAAAPAALLLAVYAGVLALSVWRGLAIDDCGCHFGGKRQPPSMALVWRNLLLVLLVVNLLAPMTGRVLVWFDALTLGFSLMSGVVLYLLANLLISNRVSLREL